MQDCGLPRSTLTQDVFDLCCHCEARNNLSGGARVQKIAVLAMTRICAYWWPSKRHCGLPPTVSAAYKEN